MSRAVGLYTSAVNLISTISIIGYLIPTYFPVIISEHALNKIQLLDIKMFYSLFFLPHWNIHSLFIIIYLFLGGWLF